MNWEEIQAQALAIAEVLAACMSQDEIHEKMILQWYDVHTIEQYAHIMAWHILTSGDPHRSPPSALAKTNLLATYKHDTVPSTPSEPNHDTH